MDRRTFVKRAAAAAAAVAAAPAFHVEQPASSLTTMVVDDSQFFSADDLALVPRTGERFTIVSISEDGMVVGRSVPPGRSLSALVDPGKVRVIE